MTLCPIALVVGCKKCPALKICPLTRVIGDMPAAPVAAPPAATKAKATAKPRAATARKKK